MTLSTFLQLGRVSNLPTVWSNCLAGLVLSGAAFDLSQYVLVALAMTLAYIGGMFLNDAFDHRYDEQHRAERPIPAGAVKLSTVYGAGFGMLAASVLIVFWLTRSYAVPTMPALLAVLALMICIVLYNAWHKNNPISPLIMGLCRAGVYATAAYAVVATPQSAVFIAIIAVIAYLIGLTWVAKQENLGEVKSLLPLLCLSAPVLYGLVYSGMSAPTLWIIAGLVAWIAVALYFLIRKQPGDIPRAVVSMIAGISLADAIFIAAAGSFSLALAAVACFALTLALQKVVSGT